MIDGPLLLPSAQLGKLRGNYSQVWILFYFLLILVQLCTY